ncbi:MAG: hypothetical protein IJE12_07290 [Prevotella sp.]|nr:hypothetical protein [Prevotella sp.]
MYIQNLASAEQPQLQDWGDKKHVPLNVREVEGVDENGDPKTSYLHDCVEKVDTPITVDNIVKAAVEAEFSAEEREYVTRNFSKRKDALVKRYKDFVEDITDKAEAAGYE